MQRNYSTLNGAVAGAAMLAILGAVACAVDEAAPAEQGRSEGLLLRAVVGSDADIAAVLLAANKAVIEQSQLAVRKARVPSVRSFARTMITEHSQALQNLNALFRRLRIVPRHNAVSAEVSTEGNSLTLSLQNQPQERFDRAYMEAELKGHQDAMNLFDTQLVPRAQNPELRAQLLKIRAELEHHATAAQQILAVLPP